MSRSCVSVCYHGAGAAAAAVRFCTHFAATFTVASHVGCLYTYAALRSAAARGPSSVTPPTGRFTAASAGPRDSMSPRCWYRNGS